MANEALDGSQKDFFDDVNKLTSEIDLKLDEITNSLQKYRERSDLLQLEMSLRYNPKYRQFTLTDRQETDTAFLSDLKDTFKQLKSVCEIPPIEMEDLEGTVLENVDNQSDDMSFEISDEK